MAPTSTSVGRGLKLLFWGLLAVAACTLGFYSDTRSCHQDETFIIWFTNTSWSRLFENFHKEPFPPFYHILIKSWMGLFGYTDASLRSFSGACFLASFGVIGWLGRPLFRRAELGTIFVVSLAAKMVTWDAVFGRMYELMYLESCVILLAYMGLFSGRGPWKTSAIALFLANLAGMLTHYYFAFVLIAEGLAFLIFYSRRLRSWVLFFACAVLPTVVFVVLWGPMLRSQLSSGQFGPEASTPGLPWSSPPLIILSYFGLARTLIVVAVLLSLALVDHQGGRWRVRRPSELGSRARRFVRDPRFRLFGLFWLVALLCPFAVAALKGAGFYRDVPVALLTVFPALVLLTLAAGRCDRRLRMAIGFAVLAFVLFTDVRGRHKVLNDPNSNSAAILGLLRKTSENDVIVYFVNQCTLFPYYVGRQPEGHRPQLFVFPEDQYEHAGWYSERLQLGDPAKRSAALQTFGRRIADHLKAHPGARTWVVQDIWEPKLVDDMAHHLDTVLHRVDRIASRSENSDGYIAYEARAEGTGTGP